MFTKIAIATGIVVTIVAAAYTKLVISEVAIMETHPEIAAKTIIKAHRLMTRRSFAGEYNNIDTDTDEQWDKIFMKVVAEFNE